MFLILTQIFVATWPWPRECAAAALLHTTPEADV